MYDTTHKQKQSALIEYFTEQFPSRASSFLNINQRDLLAASVGLPSLTLVIPVCKHNLAAEPWLPASGLQMWILIKNI